MAQITITANGDYLLPDKGSNIRQGTISAVMIYANTATAVATFGYGDENDDFKAFNNGAVSTDQVFWHGEGCKMMVSVSGITSGSIVIFYFGGL